MGLAGARRRRSRDLGRPGAPTSVAADGVTSTVLGQAKSGRGPPTRPPALPLRRRLRNRAVGLRGERHGHASIVATSQHNAALDFTPTTLYVENQSTRFGAWAIQSFAKDGFCLYGTNSSGDVPSGRGRRRARGAADPRRQIGRGRWRQRYLEPSARRFLAGLLAARRARHRFDEVLDAAGDRWLCVSSGSPGDCDASGARPRRPSSAWSPLQPCEHWTAPRAPGARPAGSHEHSRDRRPVRSEGRYQPHARPRWWRCRPGRRHRRRRQPDRRLRATPSCLGAPPRSGAPTTAATSGPTTPPPEAWDCIDDH